MQKCCPRCRGAGFLPSGESWAHCGRCNGTGTVPVSHGEIGWLLATALFAGAVFALLLWGGLR
ncbi:MAG: hypothetical protein UY48_C0002G0006 [Candidatus Gottesmanbacteria bacterium GW2011_GWB1_49_7]|uniref:Uncharacterized protein n=1 Tax=Candidatus Gottesmanbacteria bacterium GW2011_GWB1_49_7 TaxID=1618448 RepID=A0A0G1W411_9BACT|nr:MAG: hypothetical protein UY48_C0002G0006 [Candidatus Gottesmanbacteria bacterium GW2011_GWB1_49_7]